jgi:hypothetical protein
MPPEDTSSVILELWVPTVVAAHLFSGFWLARAFLVLYPQLHPRKLLQRWKRDDDGWTNPQAKLASGWGRKASSPRKLLPGEDASKRLAGGTGRLGWGV